MATPLSGLAAAIRAEGIASPAVIVIGNTARYAQGAAEAGPAAVRPARRVLVLGGARSGKSAAAQELLADSGTVDYVATGLPPGADDAEWAARVEDHQRRRPPHWRIVESLGLDQVLRSADATPVLVDCLSTWLARVMDECGAWEGGPAGVKRAAARVDDLVSAWRASTRRVMAVSSEVGSAVVPGTVAGRLFCDMLGELNARIAAECDEVWLCTAGVPRRLR